jgi:hypothetical protein
LGDRWNQGNEVIEMYYYSRREVWKEIGILIVILLVVSFIGLTIFFGMAAQEREEAAAAAAEGSRIEIVPDLPELDEVDTVLPEILPDPAAVQVPFSPVLSGERNIGEEFAWTIANVSGLADVSFNVTVYDYKVLGRDYLYYSNDWGQWTTDYAGGDKEYLALWVRVESNGTTWYGWNQDRFRLWIWDNVTVMPDPVPVQDLPDEYKSDEYSPRVIAELQNRTGLTGGLLSREWYGWKDGVELTRQEPGPSNAWEGVILYRIPDNADPEDIRVLGWFGYYGYGVWYLTPHQDLKQDLTTAEERQNQDQPVVMPTRGIVRGQDLKPVTTPRGGIR